METLKHVFVLIIQTGGVISVIAGIYNFLTAIGDGDTHGLRSGVSLIALGLVLLALGPQIDKIKLFENSTVTFTRPSIEDLKSYFSIVSQAYV
jgi:hypothetical protein